MPVSDVVVEHRRGLGTRWRRLSAGRQALLVLAHLRNGHPYAQLAAEFGVGTATAYRYIKLRRSTTRITGLVHRRLPASGQLNLRMDNAVRLRHGVQGPVFPRQMSRGTHADGSGVAPG
nr:transposase family protein [Streptomyces sporangiiformans]